MSDTFTASSGRQIECDTAIGETRVVENGQNMLENFDFLNARDMNALREFFQHQRDKELGRWRWPENPSLVAYACDAERCVRVLDERTGVSQLYVEGQMSEYQGDRADAAHAYFAAHPEPKPWHQAKLGEVWAVTWDGGESACRVVENEISSNGLVFDDTTRETPGKLAPVITDARRIWPEVKP